MKELSISNNHPILDRILHPTTFLIFSIFWSTFCYSFRFSWYVGGFIILIDPIYGFFVLLYQMICKKKKLILPYTFLAGAYWIYILLIHIIHNDFTSHGVGDIMISMFFIVMLLDYDKDEWKEMLYKASCALLWLSLIYGILSIIFTYCITTESLSTIQKPEFLKNSFSVWVTDGASRMVGIGSNSNATGNWCAYCFMFGSLYIFLQDKLNWKKIALHLSSLFMTAYILIATASRAAILTLVAFFIMLEILYFTIIRRSVNKSVAKYTTTLFSILLAIVILAIICFAISATLRTFIFSVLRIDFTENMTASELWEQTLKSLHHASMRDELREKTWSIWKENKMWGVPTGEVVKTFSYTLSSKSGSHNTFLQVLATTGIPGFILHCILWIISIVYLIRFVIKSKDNMLKSIATICIAIIPAILLDNQYENFMYTSITLMTVLGFFLFATSTQLDHIQKKER